MTGLENVGVFIGKNVWFGKWRVDLKCDWVRECWGIYREKCLVWKMAGGFEV